jgi:hypothetical protein
MPESFEVVIAGIADKDPADCEDCASLNGTYILTLSDVRSWNHQMARCTWRYDFPSAICSIETIWLFYEAESHVSPGQWPLEVCLGYNFGAMLERACLTFLKQFGSKPACQSPDGLDVPYYGRWWYECDVDSATCAVTASEC